MEMSDGLVAGFLEGALSPEETTALAEMVRRDDALRRDLIELASVEGLLRARFAPARLEEELVRRVSVCIEGHERGEQTARRVLERISSMTVPPSREEGPDAARGRRRPHAWRRTGSLLRWTGAAAAAVVAAAAMLAVYAPSDSPSPVATVEASSPSAVVLRGRLRLPAGVGTSLLAGDSLRTAAGVASVAYPGEATRIRLEGGTELRFLEPGEGKRVRLGSGRISVSVAPQPAGRPMVLLTPNAEARVVGTDFAFSFSSGTTRLSVGEGRVRLTRVDDGETVEVRAGQFAVAAAGLELAARPSVLIRREAERGRLAGPISVRADVRASGGRYVQSDVEETGTVEFDVELPATGEYLVWCRVLAPSSDRDSFRVSIDGEDEQVFDVAEGRWLDAWQWVQLCVRTGEKAPISYYTVVKPRVLRLARGAHVIAFRVREAGSALDELLITNDPGLVPAGGLGHGGGM